MIVYDLTLIVEALLPVTLVTPLSFYFAISS